MNNKRSNRRNFLKNSSFSLLGAGLLGKKSFTTLSQEQEDELPKIKEYRTLGRTGFKVSDIGLGAITNEAVREQALQTGVNYIDTSESYDKGNNERLIGEAIKGMDRKELFITTKVRPKPMWTSTEEVLNKVKNSLERLQTEYIDCLMIHSTASSEMVKDKYFHAAMDQLKSEGKVKHIGIACHGHNWLDSENETESMERIFGTAIEDGRFDVFLLVYNFTNQEIGDRILKECHNKNIGTTIMKSNPVRWYSFAQAILNNSENWNERRINAAKKYVNFTNQMKSYFEENNFISNDDTLRDLAIPYVLSNPHVNTVLYAFQNFSDIETVIPLSGRKLSPNEQAFLDHILREFGGLFCRLGCNICESKCPHHVPVNTVMRYNYYFTVKGQEKYAMQNYKELKGGKPDACFNCSGFCEKACPYGVLTRPLLAMAHQNLSFNHALYT